MNHSEMPGPGLADVDAAPRRLVFVLLALFAAFIVVAVAWMALAHIDVAVNARGAVIAPSRLQEVASLEGGIVHRVLVKAGDRVTRGQPLVQLNRTQYDADLGESVEGLRALNAARIRYDALLSGGTPDFSALEAAAPVLVREERRLWQDARREHLASVAGAAEGVRRRESELHEARARIANLAASEASARAPAPSWNSRSSICSDSRADYLAAQQRWLAQSGELAALRESLPRLAASLAEGQALASEAAARSRAQWGMQRTEIEAKLAALGTSVKGREDRLARRELVSPLDGVVNRGVIATQGGVAAAGAPILEIVPHDDALRISARVKPADIGFIHARQQAAVRVAAFDSAVYGKLDAVVERVGADVLLDENKQPYFEVEMTSTKNHLEHRGQQLALSPGMSVDASILTGERTVMQYLLKPVFKTLGMALQER